MSDKILNDEQISDEIQKRTKDVRLGEGRYLGLFYDEDDPLYKISPTFLDALCESKMKVDNWAREEANNPKKKSDQENIELLSNPVKASKLQKEK